MLVELAEKLNGFYVFATAITIRNPLTRLPRVVAVEHGGNRIHADGIGVVLIQPEGRAAQQKTAHFVPAVVENVAVPVGMKPKPGIIVFIKMSAIEIGQSVLILRKVRWYPVEDDADSPLMQVIDQPHEILRRPIASAGREIRGCLIAPGAIKRVLH